MAQRALEISILGYVFYLVWLYPQVFQKNRRLPFAELGSEFRDRIPWLAQSPPRIATAVIPLCAEVIAQTGLAAGIAKFVPGQGVFCLTSLRIFYLSSVVSRKYFPIVRR